MAEVKKLSNSDQLAALKMNKNWEAAVMLVKQMTTSFLRIAHQTLECFWPCALDTIIEAGGTSQLS